MRNDHHGKNNKLVKRAFALCLALAVICSCLLPVFATEGFAVMPMIGDDSFAVDAEPSTQESTASTQTETVTTQPVQVPVTVPADSSSSSSTSESTASSSTGTSVVITDPSTVTGVDIPDGATDIVKNANGSYSYTTEYGRVTVFPDAKNTDVSNPTIVRDDDRLKQDDAAFGVLPIEYHFWLKQMDSEDFRQLDWEAEMAEMSETEYLALFGASEKFPIWHMDTIASTDTISNYKFANPASKDDPAGEGREFAYWYTVDENGVESEFNPYNTYGSETATVVNVYAKWKDASGDVVNEDTTKEETTTSGETKSTVTESATTTDTEGKTVNATVTVKDLPGSATSLSVIALTDDEIQNIYELHTAKGGKLAPEFGFEIAPKDAAGNTVQPKGPVTVTISGLKLNADKGPFKILHLVNTSDVQTINASYDKDTGTLTFATNSFSPFVVASRDGYAIDTMADANCIGVQLGQSTTVTVSGNNWSSNSSCVTITTSSVWGGTQLTITGKTMGIATITNGYSYYYVVVHDGDKYPLYVYTLIPNVKRDDGPNVDPNKIWNAMVVGTMKYSKSPLEWASLAEETIYVGSDTIDGLINDTKDIVMDTSAFPRIWDDTTEQWYTYATTEEQKNLKGYYTVKWSDVVLSGGVNAGNNNGFTSVSDRVPTFHLNGVVYLNQEDYVTVDFAVKQPGAADFLPNTKYAQRVRVNTKGNELSRPTVANNAQADYQESVEYNGITYKFDGWYRTKDCNPEDKVTSWSSETITQNTTYYAKYVPSSANVEITKKVAGRFGEMSKKFQFTYEYGSGTDKVEGTFELSHDGTYTIPNVPAGTVITVKETDADKYTVTATGATVNDHTITIVVPDGSGNTSTYSLNDADNAIATYAVTGTTTTVKVVITNTCDLPVDVGVLLDTLPYIVILAVVAGGGVLLMLRKRRKNDD